MTEGEKVEREREREIEKGKRWREDMEGREKEWVRERRERKRGRKNKDRVIRATCTIKSGYSLKVKYPVVPLESLEYKWSDFHNGRYTLKNGKKLLPSM